MDKNTLPGKVMLNQVEILELKNFQLQKRVLQLELDKITTMEEIWVAKASNRIQADLKSYKINIDTGECTLRGEN